MLNVRLAVDQLYGNITIHHECPCRIGNTHPWVRNFYQGRGVPGLNSNPEGEFSLSFGVGISTRAEASLVEIPTPEGKISLSYTDWLMMDYFSPTLVTFKPQIRLSN